ncbi:helix-turn-helix domain-containing protein [Burkholderia sp. MS455]|uniref:helix-turn-helix domain-containing protein n=1 Tax=Burkholderia sp. MS455 TaxID=2811788 RepID=UPI0019571487|nr:helix-turn-helix domain-containing protein [Burkholderia sp. MS455]QRR07592.1 helix-turn-helix domain-containing protein [Burkholderia sp. MS455]
MNSPPDFSVPGDSSRYSATRARARHTWQIGILLQDNFPLVEVSNVAEVFDLANRFLAPAPQSYFLNWLSADGGAIPSRSGMCTSTERVDSHHVGRFDILFIVSGASHALAAAEASDWQHLLALPDVRLATNHNSLALFALPATPSADATSQAISLVRRTANARLAARIARQLADAHPAHNADVWIDVPPLGISESIRALARRMREDCAQRLSIPEAAHMVSMSERNFVRHFKVEIGLPPAEYLLRARLDLACSLLADSDLPVDKIARRVGFRCGDRLAKLFRQRFSMSPTEYRVVARRRLAGVCPLTTLEGTE